VIPVGGAVEQRRAIRFTLHARGYLPLERPIGKEPRGGSPHTRYQHFVSVVACSSPPSVGAPVCLEIDLPPLERNALEHLRLEAKGKVRRVADRDQDIAATSRFELHEIMF
jgi:hypothetical protein